MLEQRAFVYIYKGGRLVGNGIYLIGVVHFVRTLAENGKTQILFQVRMSVSFPFFSRSKRPGVWLCLFYVGNFRFTPLLNKKRRPCRG